jgi:hypothetical protein
MLSLFNIISGIYLLGWKGSALALLFRIESAAGPGRRKRVVAVGFGFDRERNRERESVCFALLILSADSWCLDRASFGKLDKILGGSS